MTTQEQHCLQTLRFHSSLFFQSKGDKKNPTLIDKWCLIPQNEFYGIVSTKVIWTVFELICKIKSMKTILKCQRLHINTTVSHRWCWGEETERWISGKKSIEVWWWRRLFQVSVHPPTQPSPCKSLKLDHLWLPDSAGLSFGFFHKSEVGHILIDELHHGFKPPL